MRSDDFYIREVDEYSEETHSDSKKSKTSGTISTFRVFDETNMQKRVNELLNPRFSGIIETAEKMFLKIQEITEILKEKARAGEDIKTYRVCDGEIDLVEEISTTLINRQTESTNADIL